MTAAEWLVESRRRYAPDPQRLADLAAQNADDLRHVAPAKQLIPTFKEASKKIRRVYGKGIENSDGQRFKSIYDAAAAFPQTTYGCIKSASDMQHYTGGVRWKKQGQPWKPFGRQCNGKKEAAA